ncbi:unnamed protein product, partial [Meganyctiphanes norvegica]|uniref:Ankyrin repeat domain-containing protein n=1 Tax=Meganyctiphanes norvegica TaxID=48144 RepID=A0AAV2QJ59_MEGNR
MGVFSTVCALLIFLTILVSNRVIHTNAAKGEELYDASKQGNIVLVRQLMGDQCKDVNKPVGSGNLNRTPLMIASWNNHTKVVMLLLSCGADANKVDDAGWNPLMFAARFGHEDVAHVLLATHPTLDLKMNTGWNALMLASRYDHIGIANAIVTKGAELNLKSITDSSEPGEGNGWTALIDASRYAHLNLTTILLDYGADIDIQDDEGKTAIFHAAELYRIEHLKTLLQYGANVMIKSNNGNTTLDIMRGNGLMYILKQEQYTGPNNHVKAVALSTHTLLITAICFVIVFIILHGISTIGGCLFFRYTIRQMQRSLQNHAVVMSSEDKDNSLHIYEN